MFFAFGFAFEIPIAILLMVWSGLSSSKSLAAKRPYVIVGCFVVGMLLTPPDIISQLLLAIPTWMLFEVGVFLARFVEREADAREAEREAADAHADASADPHADAAASTHGESGDDSASR